LAYVRTSAGFEVDFLAHHVDGRRDLIQVCAELEDPETRAREFRALAEASKEHRGARLQVVTLAAEVLRERPDKVAVVPASTWLLGS
jgi:hypothetical protein